MLFECLRIVVIRNVELLLQLWLYYILDPPDALLEDCSALPHCHWCIQQL